MNLVKKVCKIVSLSLISVSFFSLVFTNYNPFSVSVEAQNLPGSEMICGGPCPLIGGDNFEFDREGIFRFIIIIARLLTFIGVGLAVLFFVWGGIQFIIGKDEEAKKAIFNAIIGLVIIILAYTVVVLIINLSTGTIISDLGF